MADPEECAKAIALMLLMEVEKNRKRVERNLKRKRIRSEEWIRKRNALRISISRHKNPKSVFADNSPYMKILRMSDQQFEELFAKVHPKIQKKTTVMRKAFNSRLKLKIVLRHLATGESLVTIAAAYNIASNTISCFVLDVCNAIYECLEDFIRVPETEFDWNEIQEEFSDKYNFPNCCGAINAKYIRVNSLKYKGRKGLNLLTCVDANHYFRYFDIGRNENDDRCFENSFLNKAIEKFHNNMNFPEDGVLLGNESFPLKSYILKPYKQNSQLTAEQATFNERILKACSASETAFDMLLSRFHIYQKTLLLHADKACGVVKATLALHNWLLKTSNEPFNFQDYRPNNETPALININRLYKNSDEAQCNLRDTYTELFCSDLFETE